MRLCILSLLSMLVVSCFGFEGSVVSLGNSLAEDHLEPLADVTGCNIFDFAEPGRLIKCSDTFCNQPSAMSTLDEDVLRIQELPGPVIIIYQQGHGDERLSIVGLSLGEVQHNSEVYIKDLLASRVDIEVVQTSGERFNLPPPMFGIPHEFDCLFQHRPQIDDSRYRFIEQTRVGPDPINGRDVCHPNYKGARLRVEELVRIGVVPTCN